MELKRVYIIKKLYHVVKCCSILDSETPPVSDGDAADVFKWSIVLYVSWDHVLVDPHVVSADGRTGEWAFFMITGSGE